MKFSPIIKGLITAAVMIAIALLVFYKGDKTDSSIEYVAYGIYALGIIWTLVAYRRSATFTGKFGDIFGQGFRCFIVVTFVMVAFTYVFTKSHPEFAEEAAENYRKELVKEHNKTPDEIDQIIQKGKKQYAVYIVSMSIFGYLIVGAGVTAVASAFFIKRD